MGIAVGEVRGELVTSWFHQENKEVLFPRPTKETGPCVRTGYGHRAAGVGASTEKKVFLGWRNEL